MTSSKRTSQAPVEVRSNALTDVNARVAFSPDCQKKPSAKPSVTPLCFPSDVDEEEEDLSGLHPGALLYRSAALQNFPVMADALAHGADVNWVNVAEQSSTPLIQAVSAVRTPLNPPLPFLNSCQYGCLVQKEVRARCPKFI